jgi:hypothetical protein
MANFYDRRLQERWSQNDGLLDSYFYWPRHEKARLQESQPVRVPQVSIALRGGHASADGDTLHDVVSLSIRSGFESQQSDHTLAVGMAVIEVASANMTRQPKQGDEVWVGLGVDPTNLISVFRGEIEDVKEASSGRSYVLSCFDPLRRLREFPYDPPSEATDLSAAYDTLSGGDEDGLIEDVHLLLGDLLSAADVLAHSGTGIRQYPTVEKGRTTLYEEVSDLLRSAQLLGYMSAGGRLMVTYSDGNPIWSSVREGDLSAPPNAAKTITARPAMDTLPYRSTAALWPFRFLQKLAGGPGDYPDWRYTTAGDSRPMYLQPFRFTTHNVIDVVAIESTLVVNEVRSRTTPESNLRDFIDLSAFTFADLETVQFSQLGEGSTSDAAIAESVTEYGLRSRTYSLGGLAEIPRGTQSFGVEFGLEYGRYTLDRGSYSESQVQQRAFPRQRIQVRSPGVLSLLPFEIVEVDLPDEGFQGLYMIEGRRLEVSSAGFRSTDTLRYVGVPEELVTLDVRD